jgi:hypothetical protein
VSDALAGRLAPRFTRASAARAAADSEVAAMERVTEVFEGRTIEEAITAYYDAHACGNGYEGCVVRLQERTARGDGEVEVRFLADVYNMMTNSGGQYSGRARLQRIAPPGDAGELVYRLIGFDAV